MCTVKRRLKHHLFDLIKALYHFNLNSKLISHVKYLTLCTLSSDSKTIIHLYWLDLREHAFVCGSRNWPHALIS